MQTMNSIFDYPRDVINSVFHKVPPFALYMTRTVSKAWNDHVSKDEACSIIKSTYQIAKDLFEGKISEVQKLRDQMQGWLYRKGFFEPKNSPKYGTFRYYIKPPIDNLGYVPFNALDHLSRKEKEALNSQILASLPIDLKQYHISTETLKPYHEFENSVTDILEKKQLSLAFVDYECNPKNFKTEIKEIKFPPIKEKVKVDSETIDRAKNFFKDHPITFKAQGIPQSHKPVETLEEVKKRREPLYPL